MSKSVDEIKLLMDAAEGKVPATLKIINGNIVDVNTGAIYQEDLIIFDKYIVAIGDGSHYPALKEINARGHHIVPGLIDPRFYIESCFLLPHQLYKLLVTRGVTTVFLDVASISTVLGSNGIRLIKLLSQEIPLRIFLLTPLHLKHGEVETSALFSYSEIERLLMSDETLQASETEFKNIIKRDELTIARIQLAKKMKRIISSASTLTGLENFVYKLSGVDIETCYDDNDALSKLKAGFRLVIEDGLDSKKIDLILRKIKYNIRDFRNIMIATGFKRAVDLFRRGGLDEAIRTAVRSGVDPFSVLQMVTINPAVNFKVDHLIGSIGIGKFADLVIVDSIRTFNVRDVIFNGNLIVDRGVLINNKANNIKKEIPIWAVKTINISRKINANELLFVADPKYIKATVVAMEVFEDNFANRKIITDVKVTRGILQANPREDTLHIAVVDRYMNAKLIGRGFIKGFGIRKGAFASSFLYDRHNIVIIGDSKKDMHIALSEIINLSGGIVVVSGGKILKKISLPFAGFLSNELPEKIIDTYREIIKALKSLGCTLMDPIIQIAKTCANDTPELGFSEKGFFDAKKAEFLNPIVKLIQK